MCESLRLAGQLYYKHVEQSERVYFSVLGIEARAFTLSDISSPFYFIF